MGRSSVVQRTAIILAFVLLFLVGLGITGLTPAWMSSRPAAPAQVQPASMQQDAGELPPVLVSTTPSASQVWVDGPLTLTFDQALDPAVAESATIRPDLAGDFSVESNNLVFTPSATPEPGAVYTIRVDGTAQSATGVHFGNAIEASFTAATPLLVTSTQPSDGTAEVDTDIQLLIVFNRPVVALSGVDDQANLPDPLTLEPQVEGEGRWLSTSIYAFQPDTAFAGATTYTAVVDGISDLEGTALSEPYQFTFTTAAPLVDSSLPSGSLVRPDAVVTVQFTQPMDAESTAAAFSLRTAAGDTPVEGEIGWQQNFTTLTFTPTQPLEFGAMYLIEVDESAQPASREGTLRSSYSRSFTVVPLPAVETVSPVQDAQEVSPDTSVVIRFNAPVSPTLVTQNIEVSPMLTTTQVYSYYSEYLNELQISWFKEPNTRYTVTVGSEIADEYGNTLGEDYHLSFTTGDYPPFVRLEADRFTHFTAYSDTRISVLYRNVDALQVDLYRLPESELFALTGSNQWEIWQNYHVPNPDATRIWSRSYEVVEDRNVSIRQVVTLTDELDNELVPGIYFVEIAQPGSASSTSEATDVNANNVSQALVVISNLNLTLKKSDSADSLVWLTDLRTGEPVGGQPIRFFNQGILVDEGKTAADGTLLAELRPDPNLNWAPVLAMAGEPGDENFAIVSSEWSNGIAIWDFNLAGGWSLDQLQSYFYTDRPIYRPGQTVYWKGIVRALVKDQYQLPPSDLAIQFTLRDPLGNAIQEEAFTLSDFGTVNGKVELSKEALTGGYYIEVRLPLGGDHFVYTGATFTVASYRVPEFEITLTPDQPEYQQGDTVRVTLQANYFSGGPLANAPVTWRLFSDPYTFSWDKGPSDRFFSFQPFDPDQDVYDPYSGSFYLGLIREGVATTEADGSFVIELPADISVAPQSQNWAFDVTVQSPNNQFVSARTTVPIHKADFYIGVSPRQYVGRVGEPSTIDFVTVTPQGDPYPDADLDVTIYEYQWNSVYARGTDGIFRWETSIDRNPVYTTTLMSSDEGMADLDWTPEVGGQYQVAVQGTDEKGNDTSSNGFIWISPEDPDEFVAWPRANNDRIELVADKRLYEPGDTAHILVPSPFTGPVQALLTIERAGVVSAEVITLEGNSETIDLPITEAQIPNIFVSILIAKGMDETNPTPAMRIGYVQINVDTGAKELALDVASSAQRTEPGSTVAYTMTVTDMNGDRVPNTEVSVALVDRAVLSLAFQSDQDLIDIFYYQRPLGVLTSALLTINRDRMSAQLSEGAKGGGGGGDGGALDVRSEFPDIAYWRAELTTDEDGIITFDVDLPDNLTTWRLVAKAVTEDTRVGNTIYDVVATKELQVRPLLPRFFTAGDRADIGATVINTTADDLGDGELTIAMSGAEFASDVETAIPFNLAAGELVRSDWPIVVDPTATQVVITFTATATSTGGEKGLADAVQLTLPVVQYIARETVATSGQVPAGGVLEAIRVPDAATDEGELEVTIEPSLAGSMVAGLDYLENYPYECTEQTVSSFLPNLFTARAVEELGLETTDLSANLATQINEGVQSLVNRQNQDGGWGYWPGERSSVFITAYALWGLVTADEQGYTVPARTTQNAVDFIERSFVAPDRIESTWQLNELSFMLYVLSEIDQGDPGRTSTLYDVRERLSLYGKAFLAMTLDNLQPEAGSDPRVDTLLDDLYGAANITGTSAWWQEDNIDFRNLNTDTRTTAIVLAAFVKLDPEQAILPKVVRWLMETRQAGHWANTQETAWSLIALTDWLTLTGEMQSDYNWTVTLNDSELGSGSVGPANLTERVTLRAEVSELLRDEANALRLSRDNNQGRMYYTTYLRYTLDAAEVEARDRGVVIERRFALAEANAEERQNSEASETGAINSAQVGDVISVTVTIVAPTDLYQLLVEVPIPAGTEPIDPNLATTSDSFVDPSITMEDKVSGPTWWRYWVPSYTDMRDDKVAVFATFLSAGTYEYTFNVRAGIPGEFRVLPAYAEQMYFTEVWGRSAGDTFTITE
ncbi:MAG: Ig-like domain-containing protein [Caldilineaceae bacterium]|nr:Ig-like domain-containing protein [Caldilineaceae bacterium]